MDLTGASIETEVYSSSIFFKMETGEISEVVEELHVHSTI